MAHSDSLPFVQRPMAPTLLPICWAFISNKRQGQKTLREAGGSEREGEGEGGRGRKRDRERDREREREREREMGGGWWKGERGREQNRKEILLQLILLSIPMPLCVVCDFSHGTRSLGVA